MNDSVTILVGADVCPIERNEPLFRSGDAQRLFNDLLPHFEEADISVANLECPFIEKITPILKTGPTFGENSSCMNGIKAAGIDVLSLANNHILDHGPEGLRNTLRVCEDAGIATVGAGEDRKAARRILVRDVKGLRVGILAMAEHEFSCASESSAGANPLDAIDAVRNVQENRGQFDYLIVLLHGGHEHFEYPSPRIMDTCRFLVEIGANAVFVQHPHRLCGYEEYRGGHIVYGQGALILDERIFRDLKPFHEGVLAKLCIGDDLSTNMELIPFTQSDPEPGARKMSLERAEAVLEQLQRKSDTLQDDAYLRAKWRAFCESKKHGYLSSLLGHNGLLLRVNARGLLGNLLYGRRLRTRIRNIACCETHREVLETIFFEKLI